MGVIHIFLLFQWCITFFDRAYMTDDIVKRFKVNSLKKREKIYFKKYGWANLGDNQHFTLSQCARIKGGYYHI